MEKLALGLPQLRIGQAGRHHSLAGPAPSQRAAGGKGANGASAPRSNHGPEQAGVRTLECSDPAPRGMDAGMRNRTPNRPDGVSRESRRGQTAEYAACPGIPRPADPRGGSARLAGQPAASGRSRGRGLPRRPPPGHAASQPQRTLRPRYDAEATTACHGGWQTPRWRTISASRLWPYHAAAAVRCKSPSRHQPARRRDAPVCQVGHQAGGGRTPYGPPSEHTAMSCKPCPGWTLPALSITTNNMAIIGSRRPHIRLSKWAGGCSRDVAASVMVAGTVGRFGDVSAGCSPIRACPALFLEGRRRHGLIAISLSSPRWRDTKAQPTAHALLRQYPFLPSQNRCASEPCT